MSKDSLDYDWWQASLCRNTDPSLFFPVGKTGMALDKIEKAKQICGQCLCQVECLAYAMATNQDNGVWGGTSEEERRVMRRERRHAQAAAKAAAG